MLSNLGIGLRDRYARTGDLADLEAAITAWEKVGLSIPLCCPSRGLPTGPATPGNWGRYRSGHSLPGASETTPSRSPSALHRALEIAEGSKSRLLTQLVGRGPLPLPRDSHKRSPTGTATPGRTDRSGYQELAIHDHFASTQEETSHLQRLQQRQAALRGLEDLWASIARLGPEGTAYVALRRGAALTWQEFADLAKALGPATALLSFFTTTDRALLFLLRAGWPAPRIVEVPLNQTRLGMTFGSASSAKSIAMDPVYAEEKPGINRCAPCSLRLSPIWKE